MKNEIIANRIKEAREILGMGKSEMSRELQCSDAAVYQWETGKINVPEHRLTAIANLMKKYGHPEYTVEWLKGKKKGNEMESEKNIVKIDDVFKMCISNKSGKNKTAEEYAFYNDVDVKEVENILCIYKLMENKSWDVILNSFKNLPQERDNISSIMRRIEDFCKDNNKYPDMVVPTAIWNQIDDIYTGRTKQEQAKTVPDKAVIPEKTVDLTAVESKLDAIETKIDALCKLLQTTNSLLNGLGQTASKMPENFGNQLTRYHDSKLKGEFTGVKSVINNNSTKHSR